MIEPTSPFDYQPSTRLLFGPDTVEQLGVLASAWSAQHALIVTDPGIVAAGHTARGQHALESAGIRVTVFDAVHENPTTADVDACLKVAQAAKIDTIVGLGGGSSLDTAKGCNFLLTNGGKMADYWGKGKATKPMLPLIAVPTTAGTGSECQSFALIADADTHAKMACGDPKAAARVAVLDPTLTLTQPRSVTANTGIDTLTHAVEAAVTKARNPLSLMFARQSFALTVENFQRVLTAPNDLEARGRMQLAAAYAGMAIENSMLGAAHSAANPLTAHHNIIHGQAVGMMLPAVIRYNAEDPTVRALYKALAIEARLITHEHGEYDAVEALLAIVDRLMEAAGLPRRLAELGVPRDSITTLAARSRRPVDRHVQPAHHWLRRFHIALRIGLRRRACGLIPKNTLPF